ncbi:tripartite tricarboxylate transporter TctB family protein [Aurantimonas aggregata]|uniref:Tripartite tricarboxylate transporter TctB family protein n=1 Tax=Aurantimonas aggregata TaxID=2047720 RepID=A0A6L9MN68_9HYPH|nr:tripartite tricarboxylate transporter TctB family protein [Aurantimonas aggregata]NDV89404.1 tripartite tricarboxylate transporter TctB family protein [Aurantimonas aggregata]
MRMNDLTLGLVVLAGAVAIFLSSLQFSPIPGQAYGAETMPKTIALLASGLGIFMVGKSLATGERRLGVALADWTRSPASLFGLFAALGLVLAYILFSGAIGFLPMGFIVTAGLMLVLGVRPLTAIPVSLLAVVVVQQAFGRLLLVPLPRSAMLGFLW